jgi:hypothetical protein
VKCVVSEMSADIVAVARNLTVECLCGSKRYADFPSLELAGHGRRALSRDDVGDPLSPIADNRRRRGRSRASRMADSIAP